MVDTPKAAEQTKKQATAGRAAGFTDPYYEQRRYSQQKDASSHYKALDFSNVGQDFTSTDVQDSAFRRFHQMTIYCANAPLFHHTISQRGNVVITSNLPEKISYSLSSEWTPPLNFGSASTNLLMQIGSGLVDKTTISGVNRATTMMIWNGTKPLKLNLTIPVIDDALDGTGADGKYTNLVEALEFLGSLCLPRYDANQFGFYTPPPNPLSLKLKYAKFARDENNKITGLDTSADNTFEFDNSQYARIMVQLGGVLLIDKCIIEGIDVTYPNTKTQIRHDYKKLEYDFGRGTGAGYLHPLLAMVNIRISTIEAITANTYAKMLWAKDQTGSGSMEADLQSNKILAYSSATAVEVGQTVANLFN